MSTKTYETFNIKQLDYYNGDNPFIKQIEVKYHNDPNFKLSEFENEYLLKNFKYKPYEFKLMDVKIGEKTKNKIKETFKIDKVKSNAYINAIIGETDELYHVKCDLKNGKTIYYWMYKDEVGDIYKQNYTRFPVDFEKLNKLFLHELFDYQESGVQFLLHNKKCFLLDDMGSGKTHTSIAATIEHCNKVLIICQHGKQIDWKRELKKWGQKSKIIWTGKIGWDDTDVKYTIIGNHVMHKFHELKKRVNKEEELYRPLIDEKYDCIIVDEMQYFKSPKSKRSKVLNDLCSQECVKYAWALSGTLIEKNEEFYNICRNLDISITDLIYSANKFHYLTWYPKFEEFIKRYCGGVKITPRNRKPFLKRTKDTNTEELHQRIKHLIRRRVTHKSIEGFPEMFESQLFFTLSNIDRQKYNKLYEDFLKELNFLEINSKLVKAVKMAEKELENAVDTQDYQKIEKLQENLSERQTEATEFYNKWINLENLIAGSLMRQFLAMKKIPDTVNFVKSEIEAGNSTIIYTNFIKELETLGKKLEKYAVVIKGGLPATQKQDLIDEFMANDKKLVLIGNIESIGTGFNITKADNVYYNSLPWRSDIVKQGIARTWRIGRDEDVYTWYPTFEDTFEEEVYEAVKSKSNNRNIFHGE